MPALARFAAASLVVVLTSLSARPLTAQLPPPSPGTIAAGVVPGDWMRATRVARTDSAAAADTARVVEGTLLTLDSTGVGLRLASGAARHLARAELERLEVRMGKSRGIPALIGYLAAIPISLAICGTEARECDQGSLPPIIGGIIGYAIGRTKWQDLRLP